MGIARGSIKLFMREGGKIKYSGTLLTTGKQDVCATAGDLHKWAKQMGYGLKEGVELTLSDIEAYRKMKYISDKALFLSLGFDKIESIDHNDFEGCDILHDLNDDIPQKLQGKYDHVFDGGTSEHIFDFPKVMENYFKLLKVGGVMFHLLPVSNQVDHGFYMFSPRLLFEYYAANQWEIIDAFLIKLTPRVRTKPWDIYQYTPFSLAAHSFGGLPGGMYQVFFVARKTSRSTFNAKFNQSSYMYMWSGGQGGQPAAVDASTKRYLFLKKWEQFIPLWLKELIMGQILPRLSLRFFLKRVARY